MKLALTLLALMTTAVCAQPPADEVAQLTQSIKTAFTKSNPAQSDPTNPFTIPASIEAVLARIGFVSIPTDGSMMKGPPNKEPSPATYTPSIHQPGFSSNPDVPTHVTTEPILEPNYIIYSRRPPHHNHKMMPKKMAMMMMGMTNSIAPMGSGPTKKPTPHLMPTVPSPSTLEPTNLTTEPTVEPPNHLDSIRPTHRHHKMMPNKMMGMMGMANSIAPMGMGPTKKPVAPLWPTVPTPSSPEPTTLTTEPTVEPNHLDSARPTHRMHKKMMGMKMMMRMSKRGTGPTKKPVKPFWPTVSSPEPTSLTTEPTVEPVPTLEPSHDNVEGASPGGLIALPKFLVDLEQVATETM